MIKLGEPVQKEIHKIIALRKPKYKTWRIERYSAILILR